jgi:putative spermidine/putrescine transport system permease protein
MAIVASTIFCLLISFINVPVPLFLTTASTLTIQVAIFSQMLSNTDPTVASVATVQLAIILLAFYIGQRVAKLGDFLV